MKLLTPRETATVLGESERWVLNSLRDGTIPGRKVRGRWRVSLPELEAWLCGEASPRPEPRRQIIAKGGRRAA